MQRHHQFQVILKPSPDDVQAAVDGCDAVIHLACISNDPSFELDEGLSKTINFDCFEPMVVAAKEQGVRRFIYASSSSVYGVKKEENVTEELALEPGPRLKELEQAILRQEPSLDLADDEALHALVLGALLGDDGVAQVRADVRVGRRVADRKSVV